MRQAANFGYHQDMQTTQTNVTIRRANDRGERDHGWLHARFTFSFADYYDPAHMGFKSLRVMNNDTIQPKGGFPLHPHDNMEIFTYIVSGLLQHRDSMGNGATIEAGNLQYMSAGSGVMHSEFNPSDLASTELYQIWLKPSSRGGKPRYAEIPLGDRAPQNALTLLFSEDGRDGSTPIRQHAELSYGDLRKGNQLDLINDAALPHLWLQVISGELSLLGHDLHKGDGIAVENSPTLVKLHATADSRFLLFRLND